MNFLKTCTLAFKRSWMVPALVCMVAMWISIGMNNSSSMIFVFLLWFFLALHIFKIGYGLPPEYKVGSELQSNDSEHVWAISSISKNRKDVVLRLKGGPLGLPLEVSSIYIRNAFTLVKNEHDTLTA